MEGYDTGEQEEVVAELQRLIRGKDVDSGEGEDHGLNFEQQQVLVNKQSLV